MMNLLRNAAEHTPSETPVRIGGKIEAGDVLLWVQDEGPGIPEEDHQRIFERFSRGETGKARTEGAGLGLAIVAAIAEAHGGEVEVVTPDEGGTRFTMTIPARPQGGDGG
jgi:signal transduction histidine kinase